MILDQDALNLFHPDTGSKTPLTSAKQDGVAFEPSACADGRYLVAAIGGHGGSKTENVWRMDAGGGNLKQTQQRQTGSVAGLRPMGNGFITRTYSTAQSSPGAFGRREGGNDSQELPAYQFDISPDGKLAAFGTFAAPASQETAGPGPGRFSTENENSGNATPRSGQLRFTHDGKAVIYQFREQDADNLWLQPLDGSPGKQLTNFKSEQITDFHWSFDGSKLGMVRGHTDSDVVLLEEAKP